jgi:hypothetical protein
MESVDKHSMKCETTNSANYLLQNSDCTCGCVSEVGYGYWASWYFQQSDLLSLFLCVP